jgi:hypothetical protein
MNKLKQLLLGVVAVAVLLITSLPVIAGSLNPAVFSGQMLIQASGETCSFGFCTPTNSSTTITVTGPGTVTPTPNPLTAPLNSDGLNINGECCGLVPKQTSPMAASAGGSIVVFSSPVPSMSTAANVSTIISPGAGAQVNTTVANGQPNLTYQIELVGANGTTSVGVQASGGVSISGSALADSSFDVFGQATFSVLGPNGYVFQDQAAISASDPTGISAGGTTSSFTDNNIYSVMANTPYTVSLTTGLILDVLGVDGGGALTGNAFIDPTFVAAPGYTLELSPGIGAATPIPAALPLFATGLGGLGLLGWRRKRKTVIARA